MCEVLFCVYRLRIFDEHHTTFALRVPFGGKTLPGVALYDIIHNCPGHLPDPSRILRLALSPKSALHEHRVSFRAVRTAPCERSGHSRRASTVVLACPSLDCWTKRLPPRSPFTGRAPRRMKPRPLYIRSRNCYHLIPYTPKQGLQPREYRQRA